MSSNGSSQSSRLRILISFITVLVVMVLCGLLILLPGLQDLIREVIVLPAYYLAWLVGLYIRSLDQVVLWALGTIALTIILLYGLLYLRPRYKSYPESPPGESFQMRLANGRVRFWKNRIDSLRSQGMDSDFALYDFRRLARDVAEVSEENRPQTALNIPDDLLSFFESPHPSGKELLNQPEPSWWQRLIKRKQNQKTPIAVDGPLNKLVNYLEENLEIRHDKPN